MSGRLTQIRRGLSVLPLSIAGALGCVACASSAAPTSTATRVAQRNAPSHRATVASKGGQVVTRAARTRSANPVPARRGRSVSAQTKPLAGKVVGIDPGHNGRNFSDPSFINRLIWNGREQETCDTTGTATNSGYTEARFNFNVARYLARDLRSAGARVVLTRTTNNGVGPCVTTRAQILNRAHAEVAIDIHADGGPPGGRGFAILEPVADGPNDRAIEASRTFGAVLRQQYHTVTGMPDSTYDGTNAISYRNDLAGLNLTTVPKVLIECGNMRNATDAASLVRTPFQRLAARAFARAITLFLTHHRSVGA
ncbi:MAG TPA: N-acetylmuramoyl-L-alanine amidase [Solirubrobacteraceae bacterium]|nr:N-acetylmuramoyl-L-alanine amidase [Solirubrobacteraceae bacterium]